jgi:dienelactone hydrolase
MMAVTFSWRQLMMPRAKLLFATCLAATPLIQGAEPGPKDRVEKGTVRFVPIADEKEIPERYRLQEHKFDYELSWKMDLQTCGTRICRIRFPSAVKSPDVANDTVHGEYFLPSGKGPFPGVVMFDVIGGSDQIVARSLSAQLSARGIACLFIQMPYYGPRRAEGTDKRMITADINHSIDNVRQAVLDGRRAAAWLAARPEIDGKRIGAMGTSLGSFMASLTAEMDPRVDHVAILLGGGGLVDAYYDDPRGKTLRKVWEATGGSKKKLQERLACVDPLTCADKLKERKVLMIAGKRDEIVLPKMTESLWKAAGEPKLVWYDCTHEGSVVYALAALDHISAFFESE